MTTIAPPPRNSYAFNLEGLEPRDELLFKSIVRLLAPRTRHAWFCTQRRNPHQVNLRVVSDKSSAATWPKATNVPTLTLSAISNTKPGVLCLPLRAHEVETELNRLGVFISTTQAVAGTSARAPTLAPPPQEQPEGASTFRLRRWPTAALVNSLARVRMATLLTHQPLQLEELARRSGQPLAVCKDFAHELLRAGLVIEGVAKPPAPITAGAAKPPAPIAPRGLLARIRNRLGL